MSGSSRTPPTFLRRLHEPVVGVAAWGLYGLLRLIGQDASMRLARSRWLPQLGQRAINALFRKRNRYLDRNLALVFPSMSEAERHRFAERHYQHLATTGVRSIFLTEKGFNTASIDGLATVQALGEQGIIFVTAHSGHWDLIKRNNLLLGFPCHFLYRGVSNPCVDCLLRRVRSRFATPVAVTDMAGYIDRIRNGQHVLFMPDLKVKKGRNGRKLSLCGHPAWTSTFIAEMALAYHRPIVPVYVVEQPDGSLRQVFETPVDLSSGDKTVIQQHINDSISARLLAHPEAWALWNTNRWGP